MNAAGARLGWGAFVILGCVAGLLPTAWQLGYAAVALLALGLPHGASDLAMVPAGRRPSFLATYLLVVASALAWWMVAPFSALISFLALAAAHFAIDDAPAERPGERLCRGLLMVAGPALLHRTDLARLFASITGEPDRAAALARFMAMLAVVGAALLPAILLAAWRRRDHAGAVLLAGGAAALLFSPPLVGFAIGFVLLHARVQLRERMRAIGSRTLVVYLRATAPVLAGATAVIAITGAAFADGVAPAASTLFAGVAALALPHMLVTPLWTSRHWPSPRGVRQQRTALQP